MFLHDRNNKACMKKITFAATKAFAIAAIIVLSACNSGAGSGATSDTAQAVPGTDDSVPGVVNPGTGDTGQAAVETPTTNDHNAIMPDSTTVNQ